MSKKSKITTAPLAFCRDGFQFRLWTKNNMTIDQLPAVNATLNGISSILLAIGFVAIKKGNKPLHIKCMISAFTVSSVFLICYLVYHYYAGSTKFTATGWIRPVYFGILISHVILAAAIVPMILLTMFRAAKGDFEKHKKIARWTWPLWMYVSVTGVLIYFMLYQWFPPAV